MKQTTAQLKERGKLSMISNEALKDEIREQLNQLSDNEVIFIHEFIKKLFNL